ncbi:ribonuclease P protein component [Dehalococcoidia bacterium]|nr:ribonuclease P protein component [Dehalococcoidia bacterium]
MSRNHRLRKAAEFQACLNEGRSWANYLVVLRARPNEMETSRIGFGVGRRVGNAVVRNHVKRRLREIIRQTPIEEGWDMVFIARKPAAHTTFHQFTNAVQDLFKRSKLADLTVTGKERPI